jgi:hypothetical protein
MQVRDGCKAKLGALASKRNLMALCFPGDPTFFSNACNER